MSNAVIVGDVSTAKPQPRRRDWLPPVFIVGILLGLIIQGTFTAQLTILVLLQDGAVAAVILLAALGIGAGIVGALGLNTLLPRWRLMMAAGLGIGLLPLLVLIAGLLSWMDQTFWWIVIAAAALTGLVILIKSVRERQAAEVVSSHDAERWLWLLACPFVVLIFLVAATPPGVLWSEEGFGYDELEYHLQVPKEYVQNGSITYLPHNVYANFPSNVEMFYMLCMILRGDAVAGAMSGKMLNAALAFLIVAVAWLIGRERNVPAGRVAALLCIGTGWVTYLSGVAYVENGMMLFGMMAFAAILKTPKRPAAAGKLHAETPKSTPPIPPLVRGGFALAGLFAGFACGCKYTAILLIAVPLALVVPFSFQAGLRQRWGAIVIYSAAALASFSPWLIKNLAMTGNPVFPLMNTIFQGSPPQWGPEETDHFDRSHQPGPKEKTIRGRTSAWWKHVVSDAPTRRFGPVLFILAAWGVIARHRQRWVWIAVAAFIAQTILWSFTTHLYARIAVPMLIPLVVLAASSADAVKTRLPRTVYALVLIGGLLFNLINMGGLYVEHLYRGGGGKLPVEGATELFTEGVAAGHHHVKIINEELSKGAKVLVVGDAKAFYFQRPVDYCVVFNRNPFVEAIRHAGTPQDVVDWLRRQGYTHVYVNWIEIQRLHKSAYGFEPEITPECFDRLTQFGLRRSNVFSITTENREISYGEFYGVAP